MYVQSVFLICDYSNTSLAAPALAIERLRPDPATGKSRLISIFIQIITSLFYYLSLINYVIDIRVDIPGVVSTLFTHQVVDENYIFESRIPLKEDIATSAFLFITKRIKNCHSIKSTSNILLRNIYKSIESLNKLFVQTDFVNASFVSIKMLQGDVPAINFFKGQEALTSPLSINKSDPPSSHAVRANANFTDVCVRMLADAAVMDGEGTLGRGHGNGGRGLRRQRSLEWRERRGYGPSAQSSSDDEENSRHAVGAASVSSAGRGARSPGQVFASLLAQQYGNNDEYTRRKHKFEKQKFTLIIKNLQVRLMCYIVLHAIKLVRYLHMRSQDNSIHENNLCSMNSIIHQHSAMYNVLLLQNINAQIGITRLILASTTRAGFWTRKAIVVGPATLRRYMYNTYVLGCETECLGGAGGGGPQFVLARGEARQLVILCKKRYQTIYVEKPVQQKRYCNDSRYTAGETVYAAPSKKTSTGGGTLGRRTRRGHTSALSSSSTASDRSETVFPDEHTRMHLTNVEPRLKVYLFKLELDSLAVVALPVKLQVLQPPHSPNVESQQADCKSLFPVRFDRSNYICESMTSHKNPQSNHNGRVIVTDSRDTGRDSPPEPAPPEVPPRGPSLHATHTLRTQQSRNGCPPNTTGNFTVPTEQMQSEKYSGINTWPFELDSIPTLLCVHLHLFQISRINSGKKSLSMAAIDVFYTFDLMELHIHTNATTMINQTYIVDRIFHETKKLCKARTGANCDENEYNNEIYHPTLERTLNKLKELESRLVLKNHNNAIEEFGKPQQRNSVYSSIQLRNERATVVPKEWINQSFSHMKNLFITLVLYGILRIAYTGIVLH
ncbi:hypothetical protein WN51_10778 [Melipona quadrifasciata]|uniref:Uncharacterized protein n=1 Tax=Melipona quadrifasciata TaxID=166423 RepID=A0A0N0BI18_9HYME|nr:hypothetical protein WN51_10778 [Melipona quadrifasciata]